MQSAITVGLLVVISVCAQVEARPSKLHILKPLSPVAFRSSDQGYMSIRMEAKDKLNRYKSVSAPKKRSRD